MGPSRKRENDAGLCGRIRDQIHFSPVSAVNAGVADLRKVVEEARERRGMQGQRTILFIDEIHRFNKAQQDAILPHVEDGTITLIGATTENPSFEVISATEAKTMLDNDDSIILLDVRTQSEYDTEHIAGATLLPLDQISANASDVIPDKNATYIVYCRSGNRSNQASQILVDLGYSSIYDMGGIINWPYDTVG